MVNKSKTVSDLETPIADALMMASILSDLLEDAMAGAPEADGYHRVGSQKAGQLVWSAYDVISRIEQLQTDWDAANEAAFREQKEAGQ